MQRKFLIYGVLCIIALVFIVLAYFKYENGKGLGRVGENGKGVDRAGENGKGVERVGETTLIYEIDPEADITLKKLHSGEKTDFTLLAEALKRRIDPTGALKVTVRAEGDSRVEIIIPFGRTAMDEHDAKVEEIKRLIQRVGRLEFDIVANSKDDKKGFEMAQEFFETKTSPEELDSFARKGIRPPPLTPDLDESEWLINTKKGEDPRPATYAWVEIGLNARKDLDLQNKFETSGGNGPWQWLAKAREARKPHVASYVKDEQGKWIDLDYLPKLMIYSRKCLNVNLIPEEREHRKYEYFMLMRASDSVAVDGNRVTITANPDVDGVTFRPSISFEFNGEGARQFFKLTSVNVPESGITRHLAIILDGEMISYPTIQSAIRDRGLITGSFDQGYVNHVVRVLRAGALRQL